MFKVVINNCYGGFGLSSEVIAFIFDNMSQEEKYEMRKDYSDEEGFDNWTVKDHIACNIKYLPRHHRLLVEAVEKFGSEAGGMFAALEVITLSGDTYRIEEYDGWETVVEPDDIKWVKIE